ncbi:uncharacterized protein HD556DRAFT_1362261 [Suillus plorans]|uniref:Uncharacterized protein n=1 Tax=Suillus plorans TaxID=116603 RepID=A0A9P7ASZ1_9AGAM|nr:uncharacterized protein HD556DRAFT_1362261 [Suillus plorans]KAG1796003.1 hypothetical protein HD556DRAFT_1362261 [Suillus plorans]
MKLVQIAYLVLLAASSVTVSSASMVVTAPLAKPTLRCVDECSTQPHSCQSGTSPYQIGPTCWQCLSFGSLSAG